MARDLIIIGASGDGKNVADTVEEIGGEWNLLGFLDDDPEKQGTELNGVPVLGTTAAIGRYESCHFMILAGNPRDHSLKKRIATRLGMDAERLATVIHPSATVSRHAAIGPGTAILAGVTVMANAEVGSHVFIASKSNIGHDARVGDFVLMSALVGVAGRAVLEEGSYIGMGSLIRDGVTVGRWSIVGMGSVVASDVPPYHVVAGNPARTLRELNPERFAL